MTDRSFNLPSEGGQDRMTGHEMNAAAPIRRYKIGDFVSSLPQHEMCSGSSGGVVDMADVFAIVAKCNACNARVRIDNL